MDLIKAFTNLFKKQDKAEAPEGFCPACWGRQEYGGKFYDAVYKEKIDLNNITEKRGWIEAYIKQNLEGIRLKEADNTYKCPSCNLTYGNS